MSRPAEQLEPLWSTHLPTEDELPAEDGIPMETLRHRLQLEILTRGLEPWAARQGDVFVSGNQFVYFSVDQLGGRSFRGPDVFVVRSVPRRERRSWVVWQEGKAPDVIIELISESTAAFDKGAKKLIYQDRLRVPEYFWIDPFDVEDRAGFSLIDGRYVEVPRDPAGCLPVATLGLRLCLWSGHYFGVTATWLRWADHQGLLLLPEEMQAQRADAEQARADAEQARADAEQARADAAEHELARLRARLGGQAEDRGSPRHTDPG
jgi:Uma2 family endonuclease